MRLDSYSLLSINMKVFEHRFITVIKAFFLSVFFFFSSRRRHTRWNCDWSSDVCSSDLGEAAAGVVGVGRAPPVLVLAPGHAAALVVAVGALVEDLLALDRGHLRQARPGRSEERRVGKEWRWWVEGCGSRCTACVCRVRV